jgi:di/tricarboxylate transporter
MTLPIVLSLAILLLAIVLFVTEKLRMDVVALIVLSLLAVTQLVTPTQALSGFSNSAVVTVWAMFIISAGLSLTGIAGVLGRQVLRLAGTGEARLIAVIMLTAGGLSAVMNNVGVAAMMLPVVIDIARRTGRPASRLLMPLALGSLLGGLTTLIGTPPNLLVSEAARAFGLPPFEMFDFLPMGLILLFAGVVYMVLIGRHLLPVRDPVRETAVSPHADLTTHYHLGESLFTIHLPADSPLVGKSLADSRLGSALRLNIVAILRNGQTQLAPSPGEILRAGDRLVAQGRQETVREMGQQSLFAIEENAADLLETVAQGVDMAEARLPSGSALIGQTLYQAQMRRQYQVNVLAIQRSSITRYANLPDTRLQADDLLLLQGARSDLEALGQLTDFSAVHFITTADAQNRYHLRDLFLTLRLPADSTLVGRTLAESRLGDAYNLTVMGIQRAGETSLMPAPETVLEADDILLVKGAPEELNLLRGLQSLELEAQPLPDLNGLESEAVGLAEVILSPYSSLEGKSLRQLHFREKYSLSVLAIWRGGEAHRANLRDMALRFGDAILVYGPREKLRLLRTEPDFLLLTEPASDPLRLKKAPIALLIMVAVLLPVLVGWLPIAVTAVAGATLMVITRCLSMEEAYRAIEWRSVFLIAGMLPLGLALEQTGAARLLADGVIAAVGGYGPRVAIAAIVIITAIGTQFIPTSALVVLMAPIAYNTAIDLNMSPLALMMALAMAASSSFASPVSHPANVMIMGPGGYRFNDYVKVGLPLTLVVLVLVVILVPIFWP